MTPFNSPKAGRLLAQLVERETLHLKVVSWSPRLGIAITEKTLQNPARDIAWYVKMWL